MGPYALLIFKIEISSGLSERLFIKEKYTRFLPVAQVCLFCSLCFGLLLCKEMFTLFSANSKKILLLKQTFNCLFEKNCVFFFSEDEFFLTPDGIFVISPLFPRPCLSCPKKEEIANYRPGRCPSHPFGLFPARLKAY